MSKLEEVSSKQLALIDGFDARMNHLQVLVLSLLISTIYSFYLWYLCSTEPGVLSALLLFGSQVAIGFPSIRAFFDLGVSNKEKLHFIDPPERNSRALTHEVDINLGEIPLIFEKLDLHIHKYDDGSLDDLSDLAWFGVFVWAAVSSTLFYFEMGRYPLCLAATLVLVLTCTASYLSGYWSQRVYGFEDDLNHLQYFIEKRFKNIDAAIPDNNYRLYVEVLEKRRSLIIVDFSLEIIPETDIVLEYHIGFPSREKERIVVKGENEILDSIYDASINSRVISTNDWLTERIETQSGSSVVFINGPSDFSVSSRLSFVTMPSIIDESSKTVAQTFLEVLSFTNPKPSA
ncbi:MAG: hypothetical protein PVJ05_10580 [Candidatus Thorarchaeota archaeon]|jgi:hypothetical protein